MCFISWFLCRNREAQRTLWNPRTVSGLEWVPSTCSLDKWTEQSASVRNRTRWSWTHMNFVVFRVMGWGVHTGPPIAPPQMQIVPQWRNFEGFRALPLLKCKYLPWRYLSWSALYLRLNEFSRTFPSLAIFSRGWMGMKRWRKREGSMGRTPRERLAVKRQTPHIPCGDRAGHNTIQTGPRY